MALDHTLIGQPGEPHERSWTSKDALLYAVGVGAGLGDPLRELEFTTENSQGISQQVLPTFGVLISQAAPRGRLGDFDPALLVHAEQSFELHRPLPVAGTGSGPRGGAAVERVLDRSGSMNDLAGDVTKISMARAAALGAIAFARGRHDRPGIVAFATLPHLLVPMRGMTVAHAAAAARAGAGRPARRAHRRRPSAAQDNRPCLVRKRPRGLHRRRKFFRGNRSRPKSRARIQRSFPLETSFRPALAHRR